MPDRSARPFRPLPAWAMTLQVVNSRSQIEAVGIRPGAGRPDKTPGGIGFVLTFWFFLVKQKER